MHSENTQSTLHGIITGRGPYVSMIRPNSGPGSHIRQSWRAKIHDIVDGVYSLRILAW
jgi:hypothetical protein